MAHWIHRFEIKPHQQPHPSEKRQQQEYKQLPPRLKGRRKRLTRRACRRFAGARSRSARTSSIASCSAASTRRWRRRIREASESLYVICLANPFTHAVELVRHALYDSFEPVSASVVLGTTLAFFVLAVLAYDPGHGTIARRGGPKGAGK